MEKKKIALNTSFHVDASVEQEFFHWLRSEFAPAVAAEGCWEVKSLSRLLITVEEGLAGYALRIEACEGMTLDDALARWEETLAMLKTGKVGHLLGNRLLFFTTPMEDYAL